MSVAFYLKSVAKIVQFFKSARGMKKIFHEGARGFCK
jgi:hypothetical protein